MKNIKNLKPVEAVIFEYQEEKITLIKGETQIHIVTDGSEHEKEYSGLISFVNSDGIEIEDDGNIIFWEYIEELNVL